MSAGGSEWPGTTHTSGVWFEYTGACIPVYDLTTVSDMVENIYPHPRSAENHSFLISVREKQMLFLARKVIAAHLIVKRSELWDGESDGVAFVCVFG